MYDYDAAYRRLRAAGLQGWQQASVSGMLLAWRKRLIGLNGKPFPSRRQGCSNSAAAMACRRPYGWRGRATRCMASIFPKPLSPGPSNSSLKSALSGLFRRGNVCEMPFFAERSFDVVIDGSCLQDRGRQSPVPWRGSSYSSVRRCLCRQQHVRLAEVRGSQGAL
jgi:hypothetical protein